MIERQIAERIRQIRKTKGLTLEQLGKKIGISRGMLSRLETNRSSPPIATLAKIAQGLEVPISLFFEESGSTTKQKYTVTRSNNGSRLFDVDLISALPIMRLQNLSSCILLKLLL